jgi:DNA-binding response OmpR family regulator
MRVLVVEDDPAVAEPLIEGLRRNGFETEHVVYASQVVPAVMSSFSTSGSPMATA